MKALTVIKMNRISTVQLLQKSVYGNQMEEFDVLNKLSLEELATLRDELIPLHNKAIEDRKFAAEIIYNKGKKNG